MNKKELRLIIREEIQAIIIESDNSTDLAQYLKSHDWDYKYEDAHNIFKKNQENEFKFLNLIRSMDKKEAESIWKKYAPSKHKFPKWVYTSRDKTKTVSPTREQRFKKGDKVIMQNIDNASYNTRFLGTIKKIDGYEERKSLDTIYAVYSIKIEKSYDGKPKDEELVGKTVNVQDFNIRGKK